jgi:hypothetical protein
VALLVWLGGLVDAAGVLEFDLVFPRMNETYAPTDSFPVVFALQNAQLAQYLTPSFNYYISHLASPEPELGNPYDGVVHGGHNLTYLRRITNWTSLHEPYFVYTYFNNFTTQGRWRMLWSATWYSCNVDALGKPGTDDYYNIPVIFNTSEKGGRSFEFTIADGGQAVDLVAATANNATCLSKEYGVAINVTDRMMDIPDITTPDWHGGDSCIVLESSLPMPTPTPCRVAIDSAVAASMSAAKLCHSQNPPDGCPSENVGQRLAVAGMICFATVLGALSFFLVI